MSPSRTRRARKANVDYSVLSGQRKRSVQSRAQGARSQCQRQRASQATPDVDMADGTRDPVLDCALNQLATRCSDDPQALEYFRGHLLQDPPIPRGVFVFLTDLMCRRPDFLMTFFDKQWILSNEGLMCNSTGHPLTYEVGGTTGDEVLFDALEFSTSSSIPGATDPDPPAGSSSSVDDSSLNPAVLEAERRRLDTLPEQFGLFTITDEPVPSRHVAGGSAILARMENQRSSQGLITSYFATRRAETRSLLPAAAIVEAPRPGGPSIHRIPTSTEQARQEASAPVPAPALMGEADVDFEDDPPVSDTDDESDDDDDANEVTRQRPRISDLPEDLRPVVLTACELFRVFVVTRGAFPDQVQRASFRHESWTRAWKIHNRAGDAPEMTSLIRRLLDQRIAQVRGELKVAARAMVVRGFNLNGLSPAEKVAKIMTLIGDRMFQLHYENIDEHGIGSGRKFMNPCIVELLVQVMFRGGTSSEGYRYFHMFNPITSNILALLIVSLMVALQEHASGHARVNVPFRESEFRPIFIRVKATIESYRDQRRNRYDGIRQAILGCCRTAAGVIEPANGHLLQLALSP